MKLELLSSLGKGDDILQKDRLVNGIIERLTNNFELKPSEVYVLLDYVLRDMIISALRYALGRRTYITAETSEFIVENKDIIDGRMKQVMLSDLEQYLERRNKGFITDDKCDYEVWENLYNWLSKLEVLWRKRK